MKELLEKLKKSCEEMELISELTEKYKNNDIVVEKLLFKKIEDGILAKLNTASIYQLKTMKSGYKFHYYSQDEINKIIDLQVLKTIRLTKLEKINEKATN